VGRYRPRDNAKTICLRCGVQIRFLAYDGGKRIGPHDVATNHPHRCKNIVVRVYSKEECEEFERKRKAGEI